MKNLNVVSKIRTSFDKIVIGQCIEADNKRYFALTDDFQLLESSAEGVGFKLVDHEFTPSDIGLGSKLTCNDVILVEYVVEIGSVLVVLKDGHFVTIPASSYSPIGGSKYKHPVDISSAQLSPDQDLIAIADSEANLFILTTVGLDQVSTSNALSQNESLHKPVGVGWGSKETQFFGLDGRPAKEKADKVEVTLTDEELAIVKEIEESDEFNQIRSRRQKSTMINWRGDGQLIATLTFIPQTQKHYLKVWNRKLELQYMSEQLVTMEGGLLSWVPNGQYVCCAQQRNSCVNEVTMFEKNGMVHQRLRLPKILNNSYICDLAWSVDSRTLCILCAQFSLSEKGIRKIYLLLLYTMQNFHYYLKFTSKLGEADNFMIRWDSAKTYRLYVSSTKGQCLEYDCISTVHNTAENSTVVVVDSDKLLITPFRMCNIPPPMSAINLELQSLVNKVAINPMKTDLLFLTMDEKLISVSTSKISVDGCKTSTPAHNVYLSACIDNQAIKNFMNQLYVIRFNFEGGQDFQNMTALGNNSFVATKMKATTTEIHLFKPCKSNEMLQDEILKTIENKSVVAISCDSESSNCIAIFLDDCTCMELDLITRGYKKKFSISTESESLKLIETCRVKNPEKSIVTLSEDFTLRVNEFVLVSKCCTSFRVTENFLVYTTTENNMHFLPIFKLPSDNQCDVVSWNQPIEMGGTLVTASELDSKVILQMPRGNLEILHPRILVLLSVATALDRCQFINAMKEAKRHRLDMNFLVDYLIRKDHQLFFEDTLNKLVRDVVENDPGLLNILLNELSDDDSLSNRYKTTVKFLPFALEMGDKIIDQKVNRICSSIDRKLLDKQSAILCILKQVPRDMEKALLEAYNPADEVTENAALKFLLYYVNIEQLLIDALATYNTDLALMVARVSTKDPKEYLALLDEFNAIKDPDLRFYKIDLHVKNYDKAFSHLLSHYLCCESDSDDIKQELLSFVETKRLYKYAVRSIPVESPHKDRMDNLKCLIWAKYGDYLCEKRYHLEAGISYSKAILSTVENCREIFNRAITCFMLVEDWERCVMLMKNFDLDETSSKIFTSKLTKMLVDRGRFAEAFLVKQITSSTGADNQYNDFGRDLLKNGSWHLAIIAHQQSYRPNLTSEISERLVQVVQDQCAILKSELENAKMFHIRLKDLISTHHTNHLRKLDVDNCYTSDSLSTVDGSEASSFVAGSQNRARSGAPSIKTRVTTRSTKSQAARAKKINLKTGSRHEDIALVLELKKFIERQASNQKHVNSILATHADFARLTQLDQAKDLFQNILNDSLAFAGELRDELWPRTDQADQQYSLYRRFGDILSSLETLENIDLEILQRPEFPRSLALIEL